MAVCPDPAFPRHAALFVAVLPALPPGELAHDRHHIARVYRWCLRLAPEAQADPDLCGAAALVHDLAFVPKDSPDRPLGGERSAAAALTVLAAAGYAPADVATIADAVKTSSWSRGLAPANAVGTVLQDADRLDALGAIGLMRNLACAQHFSRPDKPGRFYHPDDPFLKTARVPDDKLQAIDHSYAKLLKLAAGMHLPTARAEAQRRHRTIQGFLDELAHELT